MKCEVCVDWLTFSVKKEDPNEVIRDYLGLDPALFQDTGYSLLGYNKVLRFSDICVCHEPRENQHFKNISSDTYNINTRPTSITGGNYGIVGDNGQITKVEDNSTIINETNNTFYNPATGQTVPITNWSYDYSDRSYKVTLESGDTATITYGDENITIQETTVTEGDTITNNYGKMIIDEAGVEFNSRNYKTFPQTAIKFFKYHRHYGVSVDVFSQSFEDMDVTLRRLAQNFYVVRKSLIPFFITTKRIRRRVGIDDKTHQICDAYAFGLPILDTKRIFCPPLWKMFNSYDIEELPKKEWAVWSDPEEDTPDDDENQDSPNRRHGPLSVLSSFFSRLFFLPDDEEGEPPPEDGGIL